MPFHQCRSVAQKDGGHGPRVKAALGDGGQQAADVGPGLPVDDLLGPVVHAVHPAPQDALDLGGGEGEPQAPPHLLGGLVQAADHAQLQAPAGGGVGDAVVQPHLVGAKSAHLRFRLAAKTAFAPLLFLSPPQPLRWVAAGAPCEPSEAGRMGRGGTAK